VLRLHLWTASGWYPPSDIWARRIMLEYEHEEPWWNDVNRGKLLICPKQLSGNPTSRVIRGQAGGMGKGNDEFDLAKYFCSYLQVIFTCHKILWHETSSFTSPLKEGMLWILTALKNPSPQPGLNPWTLGPMASMLTITPPSGLVNTSTKIFFYYFNNKSCNLIK
jgi:hypothetical protein